MIWVGLPAYNEGRRITTLLRDMHRALNRNGNDYKIVVYNDGSTDDTASQVLSMQRENERLHLIDGKENKGLGYALSYLIEYFVKTALLEDAVIIMDADATHNPEHIHQMVNFIQNGFDVVIASRYTPYSRIRGVSRQRQFMSNMANLAFRSLFPIKGVSDYSCSYRAYTAKILRLAKELYRDELIEERGFASMAEFLIKLRKLDVLACEVPLILRYDRKSGPTKMDVGANILLTLRLILKAFFLLRPPCSRKELEGLKEKYKI